MPPLLLRHDASLGHDTGHGHPESPARAAALDRALAAADWCGYEVADAPEARRSDLEAVHPARLLDALARAAERGGGSIDADTVVSSGSWDAAVRGAGGAAAVVDALLGGTADRAAAVHRPPGHHCEPERPMGFCLLNPVAVAARRAVAVHGLERVLVLDWDVHHGNGTAAAFARDPSVLYVSIHEHPLYPGTGAASDRGAGDGLGSTVNMPVPGGSGDDVFCGLVDDVVVPLARRHAPQLVLVSAGYDAHADDPLATCTVTDEGFVRMAFSVHRLAAELDVPLGLVLEGGYDLGALTRGVVSTLTTWAAPATGADGSGPATSPVVREAVARHLGS